jgi:hypothetical protein
LADGGSTSTVNRKEAERVTVPAASADAISAIGGVDDDVTTDALIPVGPSLGAARLFFLTYQSYRICPST